MSYQNYYQSVSPAPHMPVFSYPGGTRVDVSDIPSNTTFKWIDSIGGQAMIGPAHMGDVRPDGKIGHGGVMTYDASGGNYVVEYHGSG